MNQNGAACPSTSCFLKLVVLHAVVGQRITAKVAGHHRTWVVWQDQQDLATHIQALVVVPLVFRCGYAVPHEHEFPLHERGFLELARPGYEIWTLAWLQCRPAPRSERQLCPRPHGDQRHRLQEAGVPDRRLQTCKLELRRDVKGS